MSAKRASIRRRKWGVRRQSSLRGFESELAELDALGEGLTAGAALDAAVVEQLRKALAHRNNFWWRRRRSWRQRRRLHHCCRMCWRRSSRFFVDAAKSDPQCWAKNALAKALVKLEHRGKDAYLRGMRHHQMEPGWGGRSDSAGGLRATVQLALVDCPGIPDAELLAALLEVLTDTDKRFVWRRRGRLGQVGGAGAALLCGCGR